MYIRSVFLLTLAAVASTSTSASKFLRHSTDKNNDKNNDNNNNNNKERFLKAKSSKKENVNFNPNILNPPPPTPAPVKTSTNLQDWIDACPSQSGRVEDCTGSSFGIPQATASNCMTCLKNFANLMGASTVGATKTCSNSPTCGSRCPPAHLVSFYECGLEVNKAFETGGDIIIDGDLNDFTQPPKVTLPPTDAPVIVDPEAGWDRINCPALWPNSGTDCVMLPGFDYKYCQYFEYGSDALCTCRGDELKWICNNGPAVAGAAVVMGVEKEDLTVVIEPVTMPAAGGQTMQTTSTGNLSVDLELSSGTVSVPATPLCPGDGVPETGDVCSPGPHYEISCCYPDPSPVEGTLGTIDCKCGGSGGSADGFRCMGGALSSCIVV
mmetsp:Transcript_2371/g.4791  ORF Transcript_2371/g.4791 Transcript_2371/m.4791 type:complete len:381 (+) Transcript_2371:215-1357(+)